MCLACELLCSHMRAGTSHRFDVFDLCGAGWDLCGAGCADAHNNSCCDSAGFH